LEEERMMKREGTWGAGRRVAWSVGGGGRSGGKLRGEGGSRKRRKGSGGLWGGWEGEGRGGEKAR